MRQVSGTPAHWWPARRRAAPGLLLGCALALAALALHAQDRQRPSRLFPPEDLGLLEGPDRDAWQQPGRIMDALGIGDGSMVGDVGAGGGWFTVRLARRVGPNGRVYAEDVQPQMIESIGRRVQREGLRNVRTVLGTAEDARLPRGQLDAILIVDAYHEMQAKVTLLRNLGQSLKPNGRLGIVDYKSDGYGPGPDPEDRIPAERVIQDAESAGLRLLRYETFLPFQYLLIFGR
jgi:predicted methyltransferase